MAALTAQTITRSGLTPSYSAAAGGGDTVPCGETNFVHVKNGSGAPITVTVVTPGTESGLAIADLTVSVGASSEAMIGPIVADLFQDPSDKKAHLTYSGVTSLTLAALQI